MHGNTRLEILWTVLPAVILAIIAVPTVRSIFRTEAPAPPGALEVHVIGHQWWWEFRYPDLGIVTANELHVPVSSAGDRRPTYLRLESVDPRLVLQRGYALLTSDVGQPISSVHQLRAGQSVRATLADGEVALTVAPPP